MVSKTIALLFVLFAIINCCCYNDPLCSKYDSNGNCIVCASRAYLATNGACTAVSNTCNTYSTVNGNCLSCYTGYTLSNGACVVTNSTTPPPPPPGANTDPLCNKSNNAGQCLQCANRAYLGANGVCVAVSDQCNTYSTVNGNCLSCYTGYTLSNGACVVTNSTTPPPPPPVANTDPLCNKSNNAGQCLQCANRAYLGANGVCVAVSDQCNTYSTVNGNCLSCYTGYTLSNGACVLTNSTTPPPPPPPPVIPPVAQNPLCAQFNNAGQCILCANRTYLAANGICVAVSDQCNTYSTVNGNCLSCYTGYTLSNGACVVTNSTTPPPPVANTDPLCNKSNNAGQCLQCANRAYLGANGVCVAVSDQCKTYSTVNGNCLSCYTGYTLSNGACVLSNSTTPPPPPPVANTDPLCNKSNNAGQCLQCANRAYLGANGVCVAVSDQCNTYSTVNGNCLSCYTGYTLSNGACVLSNSTTPPPPPPVANTDPLCNKSNNAGQCLQCANRAYLGANGVCVAVSDQCNTYSTVNGNCLSCYTGYTLSNGACVLSNSTTPPPPVANTDPLCNKSNNAGQCLQCANRAYLGANGVCVAVSDQCNTYSTVNGNCLSCYTGYTLSNGACVLSNSTTPPPPPPVANTDPLCNKSNNAGQCLQCANRAYLGANGVCVAVSDQCNTYSTVNGNCLSCYTGYTLSNGACVLSNSTTPPPPPPVANTDPLCNKSNNAGQCLQCANRAYLGANGVCVAVSDQCNTYSTVNGNCLSCYTGYTLSNGACVVTNSTTPPPPPPVANTDPLCNKSNNAGQCLQCANRAYLGANGVCVAVSDQCNTYSTVNGNCLSCYTGYTLSNGACVLSNSTTPPPPPPGANTDPLCNKSNNAGQCLQCANRAYLGANGVCVAVSDQCNTYSTVNGNCLSCYTGYTLSNGACVLSNSTTPPPPVANTDPLCNKSNNAGQCLQCANRAYLGANGVCVAVSDQCNTYSTVNGNCLSCYTGYTLSNGACVLSNSTTPPPPVANTDPLCNKSNNAGQCLQCANRAYLGANGVCVAVSDQCNTYSTVNGNCLSCYTGYTLSNGACVLTNSTTPPPPPPVANTDPLCNKSNNAGQCLQCANRAYLGANGVCVAVSDQCNTYSTVNGNCLSCYTGYTLSNGACVLSNSTTPPPPPPVANTDPLCNKSNNAGQCLQCANRAYLGANGVCVAVSDQCNTYSTVNGNCLSCYTGYTLSNGACVVTNSTTPPPPPPVANTDPLCNKSNNAGQCLQCANRAYLGANGVCVAVSDQCNTYSTVNGNCLSCYTGYTLSNGACVLTNSTTPPVANTDPLCAKSNSAGQCIQCANRAYLGANGVCVAVSDQCNTYSTVNGNCLTCYTGYTLSNGICTL